MNLGDLGKNLALGEKVLGDAMELELHGQCDVHIRGIHLEQVPGLAGKEFELVGVMREVKK